MLKEHEKLGFITSVIEKMSNSRPTSISDVKPGDYENDDSLISAYTAVRRIILECFDKAKDENASSTKNSFLRTLYRKTGVKFPRYCATFQLFYYAVKYSRQLMKHIRFTDGPHVNAHTDLSNLRQFALAADELINKKVESKICKGTYQDVLILPIKKPAVLAAKHLYDYSIKTTLKLFSLSNVEQLAKE